MKKYAFLATAAVAAYSAVVLTACGNSAGGTSQGDDRFVGHWSVKTMEAGGESLDIQFLIDAVGSENSEETGMDIKKDGSFTLNIYGSDENSGTWKTSGSDSIVLTVDGSDQQVVLENNQLVMSHGEGDDKLSIYFAKDGADSAEAETSESAVEETKEEVTSTAN